MVSGWQSDSKYGLCIRSIQKIRGDPLGALWIVVYQGLGQDDWQMILMSAPIGLLGGIDWR